MIILIGGSRGIGKKLLNYLIKIDKVVSISRSGTATIKKNLINVNLDITLEKQLSHFLTNFKFDKKIIIIFNAAYKEDSLLINTTISNWHKTINTNLLSSFLIIKKLLPLMIKANYGRLIFISSSEATLGSKGTALYSMSKSSLSGLSGSISEEYAKFNITSNIIELGAFDEGLYKGLSANLKKIIINNIPSKKLGKVINIFNAIEFIIKSDFLNGSVIKINGGSK